MPINDNPHIRRDGYTYRDSNSTNGIDLSVSSSSPAFRADWEYAVERIRQELDFLKYQSRLEKETTDRRIFELTQVIRAVAGVDCAEGEDENCGKCSACNCRNVLADESQKALRALGDC